MTGILYRWGFRGRLGGQSGHFDVRGGFMSLIHRIQYYVQCTPFNWSSRVCRRSGRFENAPHNDLERVFCFFYFFIKIYTYGIRARAVVTRPAPIRGAWNGRRAASRPTSSTASCPETWVAMRGCNRPRRRNSANIRRHT